MGELRAPSGAGSPRGAPSHYLFAGAGFSSALPIPGLVCWSAVPAPEPEFAISYGVTGFRTRQHAVRYSRKVAVDQVEVQSDEGYTQVLLGFGNVASFSVSLADGTINVWSAPDTTAETIHHLLLDQVLPRLLAHKGHLVLHAGGVVLAGKAIAFVGTTGAGKSTLVASLHALGHPLLSDDGLVVTRSGSHGMVLPTYPSLRLWPDAVAGVFADGTPNLAPMAHYSTKQRVLVDPGTTPHPLPLAALYVLAPGTTVSTIDIVPVSPRDACMEIVRNAFRLDPTDPERAAAQLALAASVADAVPTYSLAYPRAFERVPEVHAALHAHLATRKSRAGIVGS